MKGKEDGFSLKKAISKSIHSSIHLKLFPLPGHAGLVFFFFLI